MATTPPRIDIAGMARAPDAELVGLAKQVPDQDLAVAAVRELVVRRSSRLPAVLRDIVTDGEKDPDLRSLAAVELGHDARPANREALAEVLTGSPPGVARRAAEALGRIGDEASLARLRRLRPTDPVLRQTVGFARSLISYRLGLGQDLLDAPPPPRLDDAQRAAPMEITFAAPPETVRAEAMAAAQREFPTVPLAPDGALHFECGSDRFFAAFTAAVQRRKTLTPLVERNAVLVTVMKRAAAIGEYTAYLYVLTHPERAGRVRLFGVRPSGLIVLTGEADVGDRVAEFRVGSLATPHLVPVTVEASYDHDAHRLTFGAMRIDSDFGPGLKRSRGPTASGPPAAPGREPTPGPT
jgi:hypothetical protein